MLRGLNHVCSALWVLFMLKAPGLDESGHESEKAKKILEALGSSV